MTEKYTTIEEVNKALEEKKEALSQKTAQLEFLKIRKGEAEQEENKKNSDTKKPKTPTPLSKEELAVKSSKELFALGYSIHSDEVVAAIKRELKENDNKTKEPEPIAEEKTEKQASEEAREEKTGQDPTDTQQGAESSVTHIKGQGKTYEKKREQTGTNTKRGPEPKKEKPKGDPYIEFLKSQIIELGLKISETQSKLEDKNLSEVERKKLETTLENLKNKDRELREELLNYKKTKGTRRTTFNKKFAREFADFESTRPQNDNDPAQNNPDNSGGGGGGNPNQAPDLENITRNNLDNARRAYAVAYIAFRKESKREIGVINRVREKLGIKVKNEPETPQNLKDLKTSYNQALFEYSQALYSKEASNLSGQGLSQTEIESRLKKYASENIFQQTIIEEEQKLKNQEVEDLPIKEKSTMRKFLTWYASLPPLQRRALSIGVFTGIGVSAIAWAGAGAAAAGAWGGMKVLRSTAGALVGESAAYATGKMFQGKIDKTRDAGIDSSRNILNNPNFDINAFNQARTEYQKTMSAYGDKMNSLRKKQMLARILAGGATTFSLHHFGVGENLFSHHDSTTTNSTTINNEGDNKITEGKGGKDVSDGAKTPVTESPATPAVPEASDEVIKNVETTVSGEGSLATIDELKAKLSAQFPDKSLAPEHIRHIIDTDKYTLGKEWGLFNPDDPSGKESAMMLKGSNITLDKNWNITLHDVGKGDTVLSGEGAKVYSGEMFDSDHQAGSASGLGAEKLEGGVNIDDLPEGEKLTGGLDDYNTPGPSSSIDDVPNQNWTAGQILDYMREHPGTVVRDPSTGLPYSLSNLAEQAQQDHFEKIIAGGHQIKIGDHAYDGHAVSVGSDHRIYVDGKFSPELTEELSLEKTKILDQAYTRFFGFAHDGENSKEWLKLQNENMDRLADKNHEFANNKEEKFISRLLKMARRNDVNYQGKTASQLVEELAIKKLG